MANVLAGNEMHSDGDGRSRSPNVNVRATSAVFVDVDADDAFMERIGAREDDGAAKSESCFRK
jgi:hypothetical protein